MTQPKFLGVIPARYASSRLPGKPLLEIGGKTMLEHVYRRALASGIFFRVVIATDDHRIYDAAEKIGADVLMTRADHPDGSSRVAEIAAKIDTDYVINIQGDEPMLDPRMLRELAAEGRSVVAAVHDLNSAISCCDDFIALKDGKIRACGPVGLLDEDILRRLYGINFRRYRSEDGKIAWHPE